MKNPKTRRQFLTGSAALLALPRRLAVLSDAVLIDADAVLLSGLTPRGLRLVREVMAEYPTLSLAKTIHMLEEGGM